MPSAQRKTCWRNISAFVITSLVVVEGLLIFSVIYFKAAGLQSSAWDLIFGHCDNISDDCRSEVTVMTDEAMRNKWDICSARFGQASSDSSLNLRNPTLQYMEKRHSFALCLYTNMTLESVNDNIEPEDIMKHKGTFESRSLYSSLSQAIQILKHSQVTCMSTSYRTKTTLQPGISANQVRFSTFILGHDEWDFAWNVSCFEIYSCFGANITKYSALKKYNQILIPPYEVFKLTDIQKQSNACSITYKLRSNLNCVYDRESNQLHSISALPVKGFWLTFTIICSIIIFILMLFVILKIYHKMNPVYSVSFMHNNAAIMLLPT
ncbi:uncharacterized protein LOC121637677 isoform X2 [Melanotaenia boesemani]|nr:uncharacterized protein LOC121637677 isoform X2 [Melanotaenia boesemani]XP_041837820.1 uncharacterized protein LOC121637677 isoform X2 [Melanotaenia boesemani]